MSGIGGHITRGDRARARRGTQGRPVDLNRFLGGDLLTLYEAATGQVLEDWQRTYLRGVQDPGTIRVLVARQNGRREAARLIADALALAERVGAFRPTGLQPAARLGRSETVRYERTDDGWWTAVDPGPLTLGFGLAALSDDEMNDLRQTPERG